MSNNISTATYIKKLVRMVYEKQKQIEDLKKDIRHLSLPSISSKNKFILKERINQKTNDFIETQMFQASIQIKQVTLQMNQMGKKMMDLQQGLQEETLKNIQLEQIICQIKQQNEKYRQGDVIYLKEISFLKQENMGLMRLLQKIKEDYMDSANRYALLLQEIGKIRAENQDLKGQKDRQLMKIQTINQQRSKLISMDKEKDQVIKQKMKELLGKQKQLQTQTQRNKVYLLEITSLKNELLILRQSNLSVETLMKQKEEYLQIKINQHYILNEKLKDYEQFAFQISQYIQSTFLKYCSQGLKSSRKLIKQSQGTNKFQYTFKKFTHIQNWMDNISQKYDKLSKQYQLPNDTLGDISLIMNSFEDKLKFCDLTEQIQRQNQEMIKNQQALLQNLQKQCEKSHDRQVSKLVQLGQVRQVLKMTKDVNRELMDQINKKEYIISECKKVYQQLIGTKNEYKNLKNILGIKP